MIDGAQQGDVRARIAAALDAVEGQDGVRVILAVESGSRAWGFPSRGSDWDVRFLSCAHSRPCWSPRVAQGEAQRRVPGCCGA